MKTAIIGGGKGCKALIGALRDPAMKDINLEIAGVCDINENASGIAYARELGLKVYSKVSEVLKIPDLELIIELTGKNEILEELYRLVKPGIKIIDHSFTRIFWEILNSKIELNWQVKELSNLENELEKEKNFLRQIFDANSDLIAVLDKDNRITRANAAFIETVKKSKDDIVGCLCEDLLSNANICEGVEKFEESRKAVFERGETYSFALKSSAPDESYWEISRAPIFDKSGKPAYMLSIWHKITEKIMLERAVESAEQKFKSFIDSAQDWISIKDLDGRYLIVNPVVAKAFGKKPEDFIGKKPSEILGKELAEIVRKHDNETLRRKAPTKFEEKMLVGDSELYMETVRFPLFDYKGEIAGICVIARDATKEKILQERLTQAEKLAALGKLAAGVAHEINNPLTGILAFAEDIKEDLPADSPLKEDIDVIIRETMRCRDIVRNLLDFSRINEPNRAKVSPNAIAENTLKLVEKLPEFRDVALKKEFETDIPDILADRQQIQQVLLNLLINAADATDYKGEIKVKTNFERRKKRIVISVEDNGPGIPENLQEKIFEPFFSTKGTNGLGLAVSWGIVERHKGSIEIDSAESGGAVFKIVLPAYEQERGIYGSEN